MALVSNNGWVCLTILLSINHVKVGWFLRSHPTYTNSTTATTNLVLRINEDAEIELSPHTIVHVTSDGHKIKTNALKVVITSFNNHAVLDGFIRALTDIPA